MIVLNTLNWIKNKMKDFIIFVVVTTIAVAASYYGLILLYTTILGGLHP